MFNNCCSCLETIKVLAIAFTKNVLKAFRVNFCKLLLEVISIIQLVITIYFIKIFKWILLLSSSSVPSNALVIQHLRNDLAIISDGMSSQASLIHLQISSSPTLRMRPPAVKLCCPANIQSKKKKIVLAFSKKPLWAHVVTLHVTWMFIPIMINM